MSPDAVPALLCQGVRKTFRGETEALAGVDLVVPQGAFIGLLGPNGAGKTTLIRSIVGLNVPDGGRLEVLGHSMTGPGAPAARRLVGYAPQEVSLDRFVKVHDVLALHGRYFGLRRADADARAEELLAAFDLTAKAGASLIVFPEGTRSPEGGMGPFQRGAFEIACRAGVPIVPLYLRCNPSALRRDQRFWAHPDTCARLTIEVDEAVHPSKFENKSRAMRQSVWERYHARLRIDEMPRPHTEDARRAAD